MHSRQFNFSMLKIRSDRLSGVPSRFTRTKISSTSASDLRSGLSPGKSSSITDTFKMLGFLVRTSSNRPIFSLNLASSSSLSATCSFIRLSRAFRSFTPAANRSPTLTRYLPAPSSGVPSVAARPESICFSQFSYPSLSRNSKSYFSSARSSESRPLSTSK